MLRNGTPRNQFPGFVKNGNFRHVASQASWIQKDSSPGANRQGHSFGGAAGKENMARRRPTRAELEARVEELESELEDLSGRLDSISELAASGADDQEEDEDDDED